MPEALQIQDVSYNGDAASYMISHAVEEGDTILGKNIYVEDGIKKKRTIPRIDVLNIMQKRSASPVSSGTMAIDGKTLEPQDSMSFQTFNPRDFENHWFAYQLNPQLLYAQLPATAETFIIMQYMKRLNAFFEYAIWRSRKAFDPDNTLYTPASKGQADSDSSYFYWDGLITKALNDVNTLQVPNAVALTDTNIGSYFYNAYQLVPKPLLYKYGDAGLKLFISYADQQKYENYMETVTIFKNQNTTESWKSQFKGYKVSVLAGLPENTFFWGYGKPDISSNLWMGINSTEDNEVQLQKLNASSELWFFKALFKTDVQIGFPEELVMHTTITA